MEDIINTNNEKNIPKIGEYVRTKRGIGKVVPNGHFDDRQMVFVDKNGIPCEYSFEEYVWSNEILKHSKNIIDLVEDGDFITLCENGYPVLVTAVWTEEEIPKDPNNINIEINDNQIFENVKNDNDFKIYSIFPKELYDKGVYRL